MSHSGSDLHTVDNSDEGRQTVRYVHDWRRLSKSIGLARLADRPVIDAHGGWPGAFQPAPA